MYYISIILGVMFLFIFFKLILQNNSLKKENKITIQQVKQNMRLMKEKQDKIFEKAITNNSFNVDLNTEIKELGKEVLELHQDFIKKHVK